MSNTCQMAFMTLIAQKYLSFEHIYIWSFTHTMPIPGFLYILLTFALVSNITVTYILLHFFINLVMNDTNLLTESV